MSKPKYKYTWAEILADPTLNRLSKRINKRWLYMSEADVMWIINEVLDLIRTEKLKLLAEVRERVVGEKTSPNFDNEYGYCDNCDFQPTDGTKHCLCYYDEKLRKKQRTALTKLEAEL